MADRPARALTLSDRPLRGPALAVRAAPMRRTRTLRAAVVLLAALAAMRAPSGHAGPRAASTIQAARGSVAGGGVHAESIDVRSGRAWIFLPIANPAPRGVAPVEASPEHGVRELPIEVTLRTSTSGAVIRFTLDGSAPSESHGLAYEAPIRIDRTTVLRAAAYRPGFLPSPTVTHTYVFPREVVRQPARPPGFPDMWGVYPPESVGHMAGRPVPADYEMDPDVVADPRYRDEMVAGLLAIPSMSVAADPEDLFGAERGIYANPTGEGTEWERAASLELLPGPEGPGFQIDCGLRMSGVWSRLPDSTPKHSFSVRFRSQYGATKLVYPLFGRSAVSQFDVLRLRGGQADSFTYHADRAQYVHDQWGRDTQGAMGWDSTGGTFVHLYLNGLYWGLYNVTEEPTAGMAAEHFGGAKEDYDVIKDYHEVEDGQIDAYNQMVATMTAPGLTGRARYEQMARQLNLAHHADYILLQIWGANRDWPDHNWRAVHNRTLGLPFLFYAWDIEQIAQLWARDAKGHDAMTAEGEVFSNAGTSGVDGIHGWLKQYAEYRLLFADRVRRHLFDGGALSPAATAARYSSLVAPLDGPILGESARWGDAGPAPRTALDNRRVWLDYWLKYGKGTPQTRDAHWRPTRDRLLTSFFPGRTAAVVDELCREGLFSPVVAPRFSSPSGPTGSWFQLAMEPGEAGCPGARTDGVIYYTTDGSDPREPWSSQPGTFWTGALSSTARPYAGPIPIDAYTPVRARMLSGGEWSAQTAGLYGTPRIAVTEIMYNPLGGADYEFLEIQNRDRIAVDLSGMRTSGVTITMATGTVLQPLEYAVFAHSGPEFGERYPAARLHGVYEGKLANEGETLTLYDQHGNEVTTVTYGDAGFWPLGPDGGGWSLVIVDPDGDPNDPENWRASTRFLGSPGAEDPPSSYPRVVVNEVLAQTAPPLEDAIELRNLGSNWAEIGGWFVSDDRRAPKKYRLPADTAVAPGGYKVVYASDFGADPDTGFGLAGDGEIAVISSADARGQLTGYMAGLTYGPATGGVSWGRVDKSVGVDAAPLLSRTFGVDDPATVEEFRRGPGATNSPPLVADLVIHEAMYRPADGRSEYLEIHNRASTALPLYEPGHPENRWRLVGGVSYVFPAGATVTAGGYLVLAGMDPGLARSQYDIPADVPVLGPFVGRLADEGTELTLVQPATMPDGKVLALPADVVDYVPHDPWPTRAAGGGASLERRDAGRYGNEPSNWSALSGAGTPGRANTPEWRVHLPRIANG